MKKTYVIPVIFSGKIEYHVTAESENRAREKAKNFASEEDRLGELEDIDFQVKLATEVYTTEEPKTTSDRKDQIIRSLLDECMQGITNDGLDALKNIMSDEELKSYGYDLSETDD